MPTYAPGDYVKVEFSDENTGVGEWMWVRVEACDDRKKVVMGRLDNEPLNDYDGKVEREGQFTGRGGMKVPRIGPNSGLYG